MHTRVQTGSAERAHKCSAEHTSAAQASSGAHECSAHEWQRTRVQASAHKSAVHTSAGQQCNTHE